MRLKTRGQILRTQTRSVARSTSRERRDQRVSVQVNSIKPLCRLIVLWHALHTAIQIVLFVLLPGVLLPTDQRESSVDRIYFRA